MSSMRFWMISGTICATLLMANKSRATVFMTDDFTYMNGQLTAADATGGVGAGANVSGGNWTWHQATTEFMNVVDGKADVQTFGSEDVSRSAGGPVLADAGTWYYAARFTVHDLRPTTFAGTIGANYFMHFKDESTFNFLGRLYVAPPTDTASTNFTFGLSSYSVNGTGGAIVRWGADLPFETEYTVVVSIKANDLDAGTTDDGYSSLWVNPVNSASTKITDMAPHPDLFILPDRSDMSRLALRQANAGNNQPEIFVDKVALGDSFADVLAAVAASAPSINANFNGVGLVDGEDYLAWQRGFGGPGGLANGDSDGDNDVDGVDLANWNAHLGQATISAIPEPASAGLALCSIAGIALAARRRRA